LGPECPSIGFEPPCVISVRTAKKDVRNWTTDIIKKKLGVLNMTQTGKGIPARTLRQKNNRTVKTETTYGR
jgi:hypothetical protein